jgi:hypothetical protein
LLALHISNPMKACDLLTISGKIYMAGEAYPRSDGFNVPKLLYSTLWILV